MRATIHGKIGGTALAIPPLSPPPIQKNKQSTPMELKDQVCSIDLAKRLKELGVKQNGYQAWVEDRPTKSFHLWNEEMRAMQYMSPYDGRKKPPEEYSAFSVAELGEMLIGTRGDIPTTLYRNTVWMNGAWWATLDTKNDEPPIKAETEADARAKMLVYLLENKLIPTPLLPNTSDT